VFYWKQHEKIILFLSFLHPPVIWNGGYCYGNRAASGVCFYSIIEKKVFADKKKDFIKVKFLIKYFKVIISGKIVHLY